jgi:hypothetical protein
MPNFCLRIQIKLKFNFYLNLLLKKTEIKGKKKIGAWAESSIFGPIPPYACQPTTEFPPPHAAHFPSFPFFWFRWRLGPTLQGASSSTEHRCFRADSRLELHPLPPSIPTDFRIYRSWLATGFLLNRPRCHRCLLPPAAFNRYTATDGARTGGFCFPHQIGLRVNPVDFSRKLCPDWRCINWGAFAPSLLQIVSSPKANQEPNRGVELVAIGAWQVYHRWGPGVGSVSSSWCGEGGSGSCAKVGPPVYWQFLAGAPSLPWSRRISWPARLDHWLEVSR